MRLALASLFALAVVALAVVQPPPAQNVTLGWRDQSNFVAGVTSMTYRVWTSTNVGLPSTNWTVITNVVSGNPGTNEITASFSVVPGAYFFAISASNLWGETFSTAISTPPVAVAPSSVALRLGP